MPNNSSCPPQARGRSTTKFHVGGSHGLEEGVRSYGGRSVKTSFQIRNSGRFALEGGGKRFQEQKSQVFAGRGGGWGGRSTTNSKGACLVVPTKGLKSVWPSGVLLAGENMLDNKEPTMGGGPGVTKKKRGISASQNLRERTWSTAQRPTLFVQKRNFFTAKIAIDPAGRTKKMRKGEKTSTRHQPTLKTTIIRWVPTPPPREKVRAGGGGTPDLALGNVRDYLLFSERVPPPLWDAKKDRNE